MKTILCILALLFAATLAGAYSLFDYTSGQFVAVSSGTPTGTCTGLQTLTVTPGTIGYCSNCAVPCVISSATINSFVQCSSSTMRCQ